MNGNDINLFLTLSKFSIPSLFYTYIFDTNPEKVILNDEIYDIYPLGIYDGLAFFNFISKQIFEKYQPNLLNGIRPNAEESFMDKDLLCELFSFFDEVYSIPEKSSLSSLIQKSSLKQIKYFMYVIKKQNFTFIETLNEYKNIHIISSLLDSMSEELKNQSIQQKSILHIIKDAKDYNVSIAPIDIQHIAGSANKFSLDYVLSNESLYSVISTAFVPKFLEIAERLPQDKLNSGPAFQCNLLNTKCIQSCSITDIEGNCEYRKIKKLSYVPFKSLYVLPQLIALLESQNKKEQIETNIKALLYSISASFGKREGIDKIIQINQVAPIFQLSNKNKNYLLESLFKNADFSDIQTTVREAVGISTDTEEDYQSLISTLGRMYEFLSSNKGVFINYDETKLSITTDCIENHIRVFVIDNTYTNKSLDLTNGDDFTLYILSLKNQIIYLDNMLRKFPNDNPSLHTVVSSLLEAISKTKENLKKMGGSQKHIQVDQRESLLGSESVLFKRVAIDTALFVFYKENIRTKLINNIVFWKWAIALFFFNEKIIRLDEDHPIQTMNFNEI